MRGSKLGCNGSLLERFERKYIPEPNSGCWIWIGALGGRDKRAMIGAVEPSGKRYVAYAAHVSWQLFRGDRPQNIRVLHTCDMPACVNPDHLWLGTQDDNMKDCARKKRIVPRPYTGDENLCCKLTVENIIEIRTKALGRREYAERFGITPQYVNAIQRRVTWQHVP